MQLFIVDKLKRDKNQIFLADCGEILAQMRKVLRMKIGDKFWVQENLIWKDSEVRYEVEIEKWGENELSGEIKNEILNKDSSLRSEWQGIVKMLIAMPNKREKVEMIVQKLSEIWVDEICFWVSERSVIKVWNEKKEERLRKIAKEAVEQSRGWKIPKIDTRWKMLDPREHREGLKIGIVWPEGWITQKDRELLREYNVQRLWETVLRMETASIVWAWWLKNLAKSWVFLFDLN